MYVTMKRLINIVVTLPTCLRIQIERGAVHDKANYGISYLAPSHVWRLAATNLKICYHLSQLSFEIPSLKANLNTPWNRYTSG